jgi:chlorobactene glucosyltransferase
MKLLSLIIFASWVLAFATTILNLWLVPILRSRPLKRTPLVSIIVPARDEERSIERAVRGLLAQTYPNFEVIVVNDRSVDGTAAILALIDDPRLIVITGAEPEEGWLGKPWALHQGSLRAKGELLLFVDADVIYAPETITASVIRFDEHDIALLSLFPHLEVQGFWENVVMPNLVVFGFTALPLWLTNRTRIPAIAIGGGPGNMVRREDYVAVDGHAALKDAVVDDVGLARLLRRNGYRTEVARAEHLVRVRMYHGLGEIVRGFTKNSFAVFGRSYVAAFAALVGAFVFHLLPYALAFTGNVYAIASVVLITLTRILLFRAVGYRIDTAIFAHPLMMVMWCWIVLRSTWVTGIRNRLEWRGRHYDARRTRFGSK